MLIMIIITMMITRIKVLVVNDNNYDDSENNEKAMKQRSSGCT